MIHEPLCVVDRIDRAIQAQYESSRPRLNPVEESRRVHKRGFSGGFRGLPDDTGVKKHLLQVFEDGVAAGREAFKAYPTALPDLYARGRFGSNKPNPAYKKLVDRLYDEQFPSTK